MVSKAVYRPEDLLSINQTAISLAVSRQTVYEMISRGDLHPIPIGLHTYFLMAEVIALRDRRNGK